MNEGMGPSKRRTTRQMNLLSARSCASASTESLFVVLHRNDSFTTRSAAAVGITKKKLLDCRSSPWQCVGLVDLPRPQRRVRNRLALCPQSSFDASHQQALTVSEVPDHTNWRLHVFGCPGCLLFIPQKLKPLALL